MNVTPEALMEIIGGLYVENVLLKETIRQLTVELQKHREPKPEEKVS